MNKAHLIVDFMPLYYKYFFRVSSGRLPRFGYEVSGVYTDTTYFYYITREIEELSKYLGFNRDDVTISVCFDSKGNKRKDNDKNYKSSRNSSLKQEDFDNIDDIYNKFCRLYDTYRVDGYEADDLMVKLAKESVQDKVYVFSPDKDLLHLVNSKISCVRNSTSGTGRYTVDVANFVDVVEDKFKVAIPYNAILLYLSTVGDSSDGIKGIHRFGNAAFVKLIEANKSFDFTSLTDKSSLVSFLKSNFDGDALEESLSSLELVYPLDLDLDIKNSNCSKEERNHIFMEYGFRSLL